MDAETLVMRYEDGLNTKQGKVSKRVYQMNKTKVKVVVPPRVNSSIMKEKAIERVRLAKAEQCEPCEEDLYEEEYEDSLRYLDVRRNEFQWLWYSHFYYD